MQKLQKDALSAFFATGRYPTPDVAKVPIGLRLDSDVVDWLRGQGRGYNTRINALLRAVMDAEGKVGR